MKTRKSCTTGFKEDAIRLVQEHHSCTVGDVAYTG